MPWRREPAVELMVAELDRYPLEDKDWENRSFEERLDLLKPNEWAAVQEQMRWCSEDFSYAARNYFWITDNEGKDVLLNLWEAQYLILQLYYDLKAQGKPQKIYITKGRQIGASVLVEAMIAWATIFTPNTEALVVSMNQPHASYLFSIMLHIYDRLPWWLKPQKASREEKEGLWFDNPNADQRALRPGMNSRVSVQWATSVSGVGRGRKLLAVHVSELAEFYGPKAQSIIEGDLLHAIKETPAAFGFIETTGKNTGCYAHRLWRASEKLAEEAEWYPLFLPWFFESSRRRTVPVGWIPKSQELTMREKVHMEWVKCQGCGRYMGASLHGASRLHKPCPFCRVAELGEVTLTNEQLYWKEIKRKNAEEKGVEAIKNHKIELACVHGDTRVSSELGILPIRERENVGETGDSGPILRWLDQGERPCVRLKTRFGRDLVCTLDQKIKALDTQKAPIQKRFRKDYVEVSGGDPPTIWREAQSLGPGEPLLLTPPRFAEQYHRIEWDDPPIHHHSVLVDESFGKFLGYFMGDGCWRGGGVSIACDGQDQDVVSDIASLCRDLIGTRPRVGHHSRQRMTLVESSNIKWFPLMLRAGAIAAYPNRSGYKRKVCVPECIWRSPRSVVRAFLSALFECDAHADRNTPATVFYTMYEQFARDLQLLLLGFGLNGEIQRISVRSKQTGRDHTGQVIQLRGAGSDGFHERVGFIGKRKRSTAMRKGKSRSPYMPSVDFVSSVEPCGMQHVFDLSTEDAHQFSGNGITVHNSTAQECWQIRGLAVFDERCQELVIQTIRDPAKVAGVKEGYYDTRGRLHGLDGNQPVDGCPGKFRCFCPECDYDHLADTEHFNVTIWEDPQQGRAYSVGVDIAEGVGQNYSVIFVNKFGIHGQPDEQVLTLRDNRMEPLDLAFYCNLIGHLYNDAMMCIEYNGIGKVCADAVLLVYQYPNIFRWKHLDSRNPLTNKWHWYTKPDTREKLWQTARKWIKAGSWVIRSKNFLDEMLSFQKEEDDSKRAEAGEGDTDDELFAGMIALYCAHEGEADERGVIHVPLVEEKTQNPRYEMTCQSCQFQWGADNPAYNYQCPECFSVNVIGKCMEKQVDKRAAVDFGGLDRGPVADGQVYLGYDQL